MHPVEFLQTWYQTRSDGLWERSHGVTIESLDNPGWLVTIDLDGTPLENHAMPAVTLETSAVDWLVCDVIAYPARLLALVQRWMAADAPGRIVCTVKFQGETDAAAMAGFAAVPGGRLMHLFHNKHELTFLWVRPDAN